MKFFKSAVCLTFSLLVGATPLLSATAYAADAPAAVVSDNDITEKVKAALAAEPSLAGQEIKVTTKASEVTLSGTVSVDTMMYTAAQVTEKVAGVKYVINEIYPK